MTIDNNINSMLNSEMQINAKASNINKITLEQAANSEENTKQNNVSQDLIDSIVGQIPDVISYQANAKGIQTQNEVSDMLLNIKA